MEYRVRLSPQAEQALRSLPTKKIQRQVVKRLRDLETDPRPRGCRKLDADVFRVRSGDYRMVYRISDQNVEVLVLIIGHRKDVYRD